MSDSAAQGNHLRSAKQSKRAVFDWVWFATRHSITCFLVSPTLQRSEQSPDTSNLEALYHSSSMLSVNFLTPFL